MGGEVVKRDYSFLYGATINVLTLDFLFSVKAVVVDLKKKRKV